MAHKKLNVARRKQYSFKIDLNLKQFGYSFIRIMNECDASNSDYLEIRIF